MGERQLPPGRTTAEGRGAVKDAELGHERSAVKRACSLTALRPEAIGPGVSKEGSVFSERSKKSHSEARSRLFSKSLMVVVMAFPVLRVLSAIWFSSCAVRI